MKSLTFALDDPAGVAPAGSGAPRALTDEVLARLRKAIVAGAFLPGDHIPEARTAAQLGVSRVPVREAMLELEREGLLVFNHRGAALVREFTDADFEEILSLRLVLEVMAARLACRRLTAGDLAALESNIESTCAASTLLQVTLLDVTFHDRIVRAARHSRLSACWGRLRHEIELWLARLQGRLEVTTDRIREQTVRHHRRLLSALRSGREAVAERAMREHIEGWRRQLPDINQRSGKHHDE